MANGTVFQTGANSCGAGHNGVYTVSSNTWTEAPDFPGTFDIADGPAALEVNGNVLMFASPGYGRHRRPNVRVERQHPDRSR